VPLSEHEQRLLEQMERALYAEDPKFATSMRNPRSGSGDRRLVAVGVVAFLAGMGLLLAGVATQLVAVGVLGFLLMVGGIWLAVASFRPGRSGTTASAAHGPAQHAPTVTRSRPRGRRHSHGSLSERMEERWRLRRERGDL
jgi:hypothetical protein